MHWINHHFYCPLRVSDEVASTVHFTPHKFGIENTKRGEKIDRTYRERVCENLIAPL